MAVQTRLSDPEDVTGSTSVLVDTGRGSGPTFHLMDGDQSVCGRVTVDGNKILDRCELGEHWDLCAMCHGFEPADHSDRDPSFAELVDRGEDPETAWEAVFGGED